MGPLSGRTFSHRMQCIWCIHRHVWRKNRPNFNQRTSIPSKLKKKVFGIVNYRYNEEMVLLTKCGPYKIYAAGLKTPD